MGDLTLHFSRWEYKCKCGKCNLDIEPNKKLVARTETMRMLMDEVVRIRSGIRCPAHNKAVGGSDTSSHLNGTGEDIDLPVKNRDRYRFDLVQAAIEAGFTRIGIAESFVHLDVDPSKNPERLWVYPIKES